LLVLLAAFAFSCPEKKKGGEKRKKGGGWKSLGRKPPAFSFPFFFFWGGRGGGEGGRKRRVIGFPRLRNLFPEKRGGRTPPPCFLLFGGRREKVKLLPSLQSSFSFLGGGKRGVRRADRMNPHPIFRGGKKKHGFRKDLSSPLLGREGEREENDLFRPL